MPVLHEVMEDEDFLPEFKLNNELLLKFLDKANMIEVVRLVTEEPNFQDTSTRCFKLPYVATETLMVPNSHITAALFEDPQQELLHKLF
mmetsp:Transcript_13161/g.22296  ORF Transcript_13161/g.22296 Transcript_13161/m.22296 type:complete len:89 (+) Transcript_13161:214-480(+)